MDTKRPYSGVDDDPDIVATSADHPGRQRV